MKLARQERGMSRESAARLGGVDERTFGRFEDGMIIKAGLAARILRKFGLS